MCRRQDQSPWQPDHHGNTAVRLYSFRSLVTGDRLATDIAEATILATIQLFANRRRIDAANVRERTSAHEPLLLHCRSTTTRVEIERANHIFVECWRQPSTTVDFRLLCWRQPRRKHVDEPHFACSLCRTRQCVEVPEVRLHRSRSLPQSKEAVHGVSCCMRLSDSWTKQMRNALNREIQPSFVAKSCCN
jgi:hypothetical protein